MFDGLRNDTSNSSGSEEQVEFFPDDKPAKARPAAPRKSSKKILGMTAPQRFILAIMLLAAVCALGALCLLVTGKIVVPGLP